MRKSLSTFQWFLLFLFAITVLLVCHIAVHLEHYRLQFI